MEAKFSYQMIAFLNRYLPIAFALRDVGQNVHVSEREYTFPCFSKFAVEND